MKGKEILIKTGRAALETLLAFLFSLLLLEPLSFSALSIFSAPEKNDFSVTDLYAQVADRRPVHTLDPDIILIDIGHCGRNEISEVINSVNFWNPKVVALDILFKENLPGDSLLNEAILAIENPVIAIGLEKTGNGKFKISDTPYFYKDFKLNYAATNLPTTYEGATIREFTTTFPLVNGQNINSFPIATAKAYNPSSLNFLKIRKKNIENIDFASREFITLLPDDIEANGELLTNKIVIIGAISDGTDMHHTPINSYMSGLAIQAASVATILNDNFFDDASSVPAWLPACILCFLILLIRELSKAHLKGFFTRILQFGVVYLAVWWGYSLYVDQHKIFDFSYTMLMVAFGLFAADIWLGLEYIGAKIIKFFKRLINN